MRILFMGYGELGANMLGGLVKRHEVVTVLTHVAEFGGLGEPDVEQLAGKLGIPLVFSATAAEPDLWRRAEELAPDVIVSTNWRTRAPIELLRIPRLGSLNVHDALLPEYAGFGSVNWSIRDGRTEIGLTVHFMDAELDTGPVVTRALVPIGPHDTAGAVLSKLLDEYVPVTLRALELVESGHRGERQPATGGTFYHRIGVEDTRIDWRDGTTQVYNLVRGQSDPFLNAWTTHNGGRLYVKVARPPERGYCGTPGRVVRAAEGGVAVACGRRGDPDARGLILLQVATEDGPPVRAVDYFTKMGGYLE
ncbi:methionyl-tRNA formyltransferase [Sphaerisporangium siamense]|uniref:Methionyl-tRNA formyltransferase n=2 Tax=Sphaerisporangium siamense TaxID=795645 RepID=A0A7W7GA78_9ACTN|nr:methionyl-tRNA formyltransferase [Sphaerisporangium siamense]MBB4701455.1 methionyl-tRNA formyltransferase [Sphaerisporangium siamense]